MLKKKSAFSDRQSIDDSALSLFGPSGSFILLPYIPTGNITLEEHVALIRNSSALYSAKLTHMLFIYDSLLARGADSATALASFFQLADSWHLKKHLSKEELDVLYRARAKDPSAIQLLINAQPEIIKLPFVLEYLVDILKKYRSSRRGTLKPLEREWRKLLPSRAKGNVPYSAQDIKACVIAEARINKKNPKPHVAKALDISLQHIRKVAPLKSGPGCLKKGGR